jgi:hypothetical protein
VQGVTIEGNTSTPWGAAGNALLREPLAAGDAAWLPPRQLMLRRLSLPAGQMWGSLTDPAAAGDRRRRARRLLAPGAPGAAGPAGLASGGGGGGPPTEDAYYVFMDTALRFMAGDDPAASAVEGEAEGGRPSAALVGGLAGGAAAVGALLLAGGALLVARRRALAAGGGGEAGKSLLPFRRGGWGGGGRRGGGGPDAGGAALYNLEGLREASVLVSRLRSDLQSNPAAWAAAAAAGAEASQFTAGGGLGAFRGHDSTTQGPAARGDGGADDERTTHQRQQFESATRAVQALHQGNTWRHAQEDLVLESVLGQGTFGMVRGRGRWWGPCRAALQQQAPETRCSRAPVLRAAPACLPFHPTQPLSPSWRDPPASPRRVVDSKAPAARPPSPSPLPPGVPRVVEGHPRGGEAHDLSGRHERRRQARAHGHHGDRHLM